MAWTSKKVEDQRKEFITAYQEKQLTMTEVCHEFGISRKTGYKWISRFASEGTDGLRDQSKARHTQSQKVSEGGRAISLRLSNAMANGVLKRFWLS